MTIRVTAEDLRLLAGRLRVTTLGDGPGIQDDRRVAELARGLLAMAQRIEQPEEDLNRDLEPNEPAVHLVWDYGDVRLESVKLTRCGDAYHLRVETRTKHFDISFGGGDGALRVFLEPEPMLDGERSTCITLLGLDGYTATHRHGKSWLDVVLVRIREDAPVVWEWCAT